MSKCYFCEEGKDFSISKKRLGDSWPYKNDVVFHDDKVFAVVGVAPQVVPYVLILPYRHIYSLSEMTIAEKNSLHKCLDYLLDRAGYGNELCIFEHGGKSESGSSSIDHCHIHVIDGKYGLFQHEEFARFSSYTNYIPAITGPYLMVGKYTRNHIVLKISGNQQIHEHQFFRKKLAEIIGEKRWDWHEDERIDHMIKVMKGFKKKGKNQ